MSDDSIDPAAIAETVALDRARGGRWTRTAAGGYRRMTSLEVLCERGQISGHALSGAQNYRTDYLTSIESASMRSTIYAKIGARDDEDEVMARASRACALIARIHREVIPSLTIKRLVDEICGRDGASAQLERAAIRHDVPACLEKIADWYERNDQRGERERDTEAMQLVDLEGWWAIAQAFSPRMGREAFLRYWNESGMAELQEEDRKRAEIGSSITKRLRPLIEAKDVEARARTMFREFTERFRVRASEWRLLSEQEKRRWRDQATAELERAA